MFVQTAEATSGGCTASRHDSSRYGSRLAYRYRTSISGHTWKSAFELMGKVRQNISVSNHQYSVSCTPRSERSLHCRTLARARETSVYHFSFLSSYYVRFFAVLFLLLAAVAAATTSTIDAACAMLRCTSANIGRQNQLARLLNIL